MMFVQLVNRSDCLCFVQTEYVFETLEDMTFQGKLCRYMILNGLGNLHHESSLGGCEDTNTNVAVWS